MFNSNGKTSPLVWHVLAVITIAFWGTSFVSTKVLIEHGFSAVQIFFIRFACTYLILLCASHKKFVAKSIADELKFLLGGFTGGTLYFWTENTALSLSPSSNVSLIVCTNPLLIMLAGVLFFKREKLVPRQIVGSVITFFGMVLVVLNGRFVLNLSPLGDILAFTAAISWTFYAYSTDKIRSKYGTFFSIRKVFFYAFVTAMPLMIADYFGFMGEAHTIPWHAFKKPVVALNFLCLAVFAGVFGYLVWNKVMEKLGTIFASNYVYGIPLVTIVTASLTVGERITAMAWTGAAAIILGMVMAEYKKKGPNG
ncbi:MAG: DMT family transporter [Fibrobacter sp.]|nr:DMT family transporter [Fibrobacter sp.]